VRQPQLPRLRSRQGKAAIVIAALHMAVIWSWSSAGLMPLATT